MKTKRSKNRLIFLLNKKTIAHLNRRDMIRAGGGAVEEGDQIQPTDPIICGDPQTTPVPLDFGIPPQSP